MNRLVRAMGLAALGLTMAGCAITPSNGGSQSTKITFTVQLAGPFNPNYIYVVPMYISTDLQPPVATTLLATPTLNGTFNEYFAGEATDYVVVDYQKNSNLPFEIYQVGNPSDPGVGIGDTLLGNTPETIIADDQGNWPSSFSFTINTSQIAGGNIYLAQQYKSMSFQIIAMNLPAMGSSPASGRVVGGLGVNNFQVPPSPVLLTSSHSVDSATYGNIATGYTDPPSNDPALKIVGFTVGVSVPTP